MDKNKHIHTQLGALILIAFFSAALLGITITSQMSEEELGFSFLKFPQISSPEILIPDEGEPTEEPQADIEIQGIEKFASESEFKEYLEKAQEEAETTGYNMGGAMRTFASEEMTMDTAEGMPAPTAKNQTIDVGVEPQRISETNVQVAGIDEPDIVKTDGSKIYFSPRFTQYYRGRWDMPMPEGGISERGTKQYGETKIINAFPAEDLALENDIDKSGELLLWKDTLIIFAGEQRYYYGGKNYGDRVYGYDISNPKNPEKLWEIKIQDKNSIITSRLFNDKIYLITKSIINEYHPCPIRPMEVNGKMLTIECSQIYHPVSPIPTDSAFIAMTINPKTGEIQDKTSFVGSSGNSILYMSENGIYITYPYSQNIAKFFINFLTEKTRDLLPLSLIEKIEKLEGYDISQNAKMTELQTILEKYSNSLDIDEDEKLRMSNEMTNRMSDYYQEHKRDLEQTGIVKIGTDSLEVEASGNVPGYPLNQFALDEYQGNLRVAITVGERWFGYLPGISGSRGASANDVYVLDANLGIIGSVKDLGLTEKIYSVRFIQDKGYVVTFRQIDPFYVLDLSDPYNPELKGELKIPGYSAYLHPITKDKILGIGKEDRKVKISLFDVSSPENPKETDKYILDEWHTDILSTHHAFLLDKKHNIFFLPGSKGGYVFSYENDELKLKKAISQTSARRAIYIDDFLYIISDNEITVLNEITWKKQTN